MSIAGAYLRDFEPFKNQSIEFKPPPAKDLANVHFFVGQNGTGKTRLLSLLASACGNPEELKFRTRKYTSVVVGRVMENGAERFRFHLAGHGGLISRPGPLPELLSAAETSHANSESAFAKVTDTVAMAFRSIPSLEDQQVAPMAEVRWPDRPAFLKFAHHAGESAQLCQALANLKVRMGIVSSDPKDRAVRMVHAFDKAIQSITSSELILTVGYVGKDFRLKVSWLGKELQLNQLPDGLRAIVGWLASVVCKLDALLPDVESPLEQPLILLLDEPDAYLHPAWQRKLIPAVQRLLPNAQIFVATHSPFVISSVNSGWTYIFEADSAGKVTIKPPVSCSQGDSYIDVVEDILGVKERFDPETEDCLQEFRSKRDDYKRQPAVQALKELQSLAEQIAQRSQTLHFMMGREMAQLNAQVPVETTKP